MKTAVLTLIFFITPLLFADKEVSLLERATLSVHVCNSGVLCEVIQRILGDLTSSRHLVQDMELCASGPFVSFTVVDGAIAPKGYIYDSSNRRLYSVPAVDGQEKRWSPSGLFTVVSYKSAGSIYIVRTAELREFLDSESEEHVYLKIYGDPYGSTYADAWLGDRFLIFSTGQGDVTYWGLADTSTRSVYVISNQDSLVQTTHVDNVLYMLLHNTATLMSCSSTNFLDSARELARTSRRALE